MPVGNQRSSLYGTNPPRIRVGIAPCPQTRPLPSRFASQTIAVGCQRLSITQESARTSSTWGSISTFE